MRIILLLPQLVYGKHGGFVGGYVNSVLNLAEVMQRHAEVTLVAGVSRPSGDGLAELQQKLAQTDLELLDMKARPSTVGYFFEFSRRVRKVCANAPAGIDFVYGHSGHPGYGLSTWLAGRGARSRAVHALYCPVSEEFQHKKMGFVTRLLTRQAFRRVPTTVAISENVRNSITEFTQGKTTAHIILPVIPDDFTAVKKSARLDVNEKQTLVMGFVGHHKPEKGFDLALDAVDAAVAKGHSVSLLALTSGAESQGSAGREVQAMVAARKSAARIRLVQGIKDIRDFYAQVDVMLVPFRGTRGPSDYPMVLLEAMSVGVPVACTPVGAMPEVVRHGQNGFLSKDTTGAAFASMVVHAIETLQSNKGTIAAAALATAGQFRASAVSRQTLQFFEQLRSSTP